MADPYVGIEPLGDTAEERVLALERVISRLNLELGEWRDSFSKITYVAPTRPREGMIRFADGTEWDPSGDGTVGYHQYANGAWVAM